MKKGILLGCVLALAACGGNNEENNANGDPNNGTNNMTTPNNGTNNMTTPNNGTNNMTTPNNGTNNMTTPNNGTNNMTNNTVANPYMLMGECGDLEFDQDGDGTLEATQLQELDADGGDNPTALVTDLMADGTTDWANRTEWDAEGRELARDEDIDGDGTYDRHIEWTYDADGNLTSLSVDEGDTMDAFTIVATYDANGNLLTWERDGSFDDMNNLTPADGTPDYTDTRTYNGVNIATLEIDGDGDGDPEMVITNTFDADGYQTGHERDGIYLIDQGMLVRAADGTADLIRTFTVNAMGQIQTLDEDGDVGDMLEQSDGTIDRSERNFVYDADGNVTSFEMDGRRNAGNEYTTQVADGTWDSFTLTWDADGNQTGVAFDEGDDGSDDVVIVRTFDAMGRALSINRDGVVDNEGNIIEAADGTDDWIETITWHATMDQILTRNVDVDNDGTDEYVAMQEFNDNDDPVHVTEDGELDINEVVEAADGTLDLEITWTYDAMGRITSFNEMIDGAQGQTGTWTYGMCVDFL